MFEYPYGDMEQLNLDWVMEIVKNLIDKLSDLETRVEALEGGNGDGV